jgi:hypothetical protein
MEVLTISTPLAQTFHFNVACSQATVNAPNQRDVGDYALVVMVEGYVTASNIMTFRHPYVTIV